MKKISTIEEVIYYNRIVSQNLNRTPEPEPITNQVDSVKDYDQILNVNTIGNYTIILDVIYRCLPEKKRKFKALDLGSGPGHLALNQAKYFDIDQLLGIDLSELMVQIANQNTLKYKLENRVEFKVMDCMECLQKTENDFYDLVTFNNTAHHLTTLESVGDVVKEIDRITSHDGLIVFSDVARLKTADITEAFINITASDYIKQNMYHMYEDLRNTMYAAWLPNEIATIIPRNSRRNWFQIVPQYLPYFQFIIGVSQTCQNPYMRDSKDWEKTDFLDRPQKRAAYQALKRMFSLAPQINIDDI